MKVFIRTITPAYIEVTNQSSSTKEFKLDFIIVEYDLHFSRMNVVKGSQVIDPGVASIAEMEKIIHKSIQKGLNAEN